MPDTWKGVVAKAKPGDAHYGVSFKDMKNNVAAQRAAADQISREYEASIRRNNMPNIPSSYYLFHGHGGKAVDLYNNPDKQLKDIYYPYARDKKGQDIINPKTGEPVKSIVYQQNPDWKPNQKVADFISVRAAKMGDKMSDLYPGNRNLASTPPVKTTPSVAVNTQDKPVPPVAKPKEEPSVVTQYVDSNQPKKDEPSIASRVKKAASDIASTAVSPGTSTATPAPKPEKKIEKPELTVGTPEYDRRMEKLQTAAGDKFSKERQARLDKEQQSTSAPMSDPEADPKAWAEYERRMEKLQTAAGDKFSQERQAAQKNSPEDDSYLTKFMNLFK
jgi:hypothetical protein